MIEQDHPHAWWTADLEAPRGFCCNLQIETGDMTGMRDRLLRAGRALFRDLADTWYDVGEMQIGQREFLVQDPDRYLLRFVEPLGERTR